MSKQKKYRVNRDIQKKLVYVFAIISANTYSRETSRISTESAWQEVSNDIQLSPLPG